MRDLPSGTVTFLFTDIERSTALVDRLGPGYVAVLEQHREVLRWAFTSHAGYEVDTQGDAFFVAFARAGDAVAAAVAAQRALAAYPWPTDGEVQVRMGLHTGEPIRTESGYVGLDVHRAARLMAAGHGGQVLLSQTTCSLVEDELPEGVSLRALGEHRLRDLIRPLHISQLEIAELVTDFPPLKTLDNRPHNLPVQSTPLIGREHELEAAHDLLHRDTIRLLTLTGVGGSGKTRLALQIAAEELSDYPDGVFFVPLAPVSDSFFVLQTIAHTLGLKESGGQPLTQVLQSFLRDKQMLLLLDNFEQVVEAAPQVAELLSHCPQIKILVTSREALRLRGEQEFSVPPRAIPSLKSLLLPVETLTQYAAVELFIQRAQAVKLDFTVTNDNAPAVAEICSRLDGLPLAIELAAARIKLLSPQALLTRLETRLKLLTGGARDLPARHQTLRAAIAWSYDLLTEVEKTLFWRLAVFVGGCTLEAVEKVCYEQAELEMVGRGMTALDDLASLVDKSLLRQEERDGQARFFMLETVREYAFERLTESGKKEEVQRRHAAFFLSMAEAYGNTYNTPKFSQALDRIETEHDNMRVALLWCKSVPEGAEIGLRMVCALRLFWDIHGYWSEARSQLADVLSFTKGTEGAEGQKLAPLRLDAFLRSGWMASQQGDKAEARAHYEEALSIAEQSGDKRTKAGVLMELSWVLGGEHREEARALNDQRLAIGRELDDNHLIAQALCDTGRLLMVQDDFEGAQAHFEQSLEMLREAGDKSGIAHLLGRLGDLATIQKKYPEARSYFEQTLILQQERQMDEGIAFTLISLGRVAQEEKDYEMARHYYKRSLSILERMGHKRSIADTYVSLGDIAGQEGDYDEARSCYERSRSLAQELGHLERMVRAVRKQSHFARLQGDLKFARLILEEGLQLCQGMERAERTGATSDVLTGLCDLAVEESDYSAARRWGLELLGTMRDAGNRVGIVARLLFMAQVARAAGNLPDARTFLNEALVLFPQLEEIAQEHGQYPVLETCGMLAAAEGQYERAARLLGAAEKRWNALIQEFGEADVVSLWRGELHRCVDAARKALGDEAFAAEWAEGQKIAPEEAVRYALEDFTDA